MSEISSNNTLKLIQVAIAVPLNRLFDYSATPEQYENVEIGMRVLVPFGTKAVVGIVVGKQQQASIDKSKVKAISCVLDKNSAFDAKALTLANWLSNFYLFPLGDVFSAMLPKLLRKAPTALDNDKRASIELAHEDYLQVIPANEPSIKALSKSKRQWDLYQRLVQQKNGEKMKIIKSDYSSAIVNGLINKSLARIKKIKPKERQWQANIILGEKKRANAEQGIAIASINQASDFTSFLLEGVTGSGKTEVYLQVIEEIILRGKQVLVLVPEIGLTPQTVARFQQRFGEVIGVWHSGLTDHERLNLWKNVKHNQLGVIIGTRSSVFLPFSKLGMIIVDEEHDESFKQQDSLRYHARDVAAYRARQHQIPLVLGSATPSLESLHNALSYKYRHIQLTQRAGSASMPSMHLLDTAGQQMQSGIAPSMIARMQQQLSQGNQVLVFVNRRGYAPALICESCAHVETCLDCDTPFTYHQQSHNLQCHRCGQFKSYQPSCSECTSKNMTTQGVGTEQIQAHLSRTFQDYSCVRIDSDSTRGKRKLNTLLDEINKNKHQILVGTQILSKGHHFPNVTLALIVNVDSFLFSSDFRASEKLAQLVTQLSGRAGRANKPGEVWLQTMQVGNPLLQDLVNNGYSHFSRLLLQERLKANLPPAQYQIALRVEHKEQAVVFEFMQYANLLLAQFKQLRFVGPFPAGVEKKQTRFRFITVVQSASNRYLNQALKQVQQELSEHKLANRIRWNLDVMPMDFA